MGESPSLASVVDTRIVEALGVKMDWPVAELRLTDDDRQVVLCYQGFLLGATLPLSSTGNAAALLDGNVQNVVRPT